MSTFQSLQLGIRSSGAYFFSTFLFGVMFGITASAVGLGDWQALVMSATSFTASAQFAALRLRHIAGIQPILEVLPDCAFMAILAPAIRQGSASELLAKACLVVIMWRTDNVALATIVGMSVLFSGNSLLG